jgi:hypothetical protein
MKTKKNNKSCCSKSECCENCDCTLLAETLRKVADAIEKCCKQGQD